ncbi:VL96-like protein [Mya arenaria]|uniref:VL96-like protein n=1 Tax=Mya arenaria TaxID=6604 RepID=A0ABY7E7W9_MYAAR|nr:VL96-like protein [Mya arenaria]
MSQETNGHDNSPSSEQIRQDKRQVQVTDEVSKTNSTGNIDNNWEFTGQALKYDTIPEKPKRMQTTATNVSINPALSQRKASKAHAREAPIPSGTITPARQWTESESDSEDDNKGRRHRVVPMKPRFQSGSYPSTHWNKSYSDTSNSERQGSYSQTDYIDDDFIVDDLDMDTFDEIPPYDEIPYALISCGVYDEKSIRIARRKQVQKKLLQNFQRDSNVPSNGDKNGQIHEDDQELKDTEKEMDDLINGLKDLAEGNNDKPKNALFETRQHQDAKIQNQQTLSQPSTFEENDMSNPDIGDPPFTTSSTDSSNSLKMSVTRNSKTSTTYKHTGEYLNKNKMDLMNASTTILETQKDVQRPPSPINVKSSEDEKNTKANCLSSRHESEQETRMREKRLQKFQQDRKSACAVNRNTPKLDNRDLAPNSQPLLKPIKCTAFKHNLTVEVLNKEQENKEAIYDKHENKTQHEMHREVTQNNVSIEHAYSTLMETADEKSKEILNTQHNTPSNESDSDDDCVVPTAMRVLNTSKRKNEASKSKRDLTETLLGTILSIATENKIKPALKGSGEQNGQKIDNGDTAPKAQPMSKSITCKAVKHNSSVEVLNKEQENKKAIHIKHDNKTQPEMPRKVKQEIVSTERVNSTRTVKADKKPGEIKETQHTLSSNESDSDDDSVVLTAMRALNTPDRNDKACKCKCGFADTLFDTLLSISTDNKTKPALKGSKNKNKTSTKSSSGSGILKDKVSKTCMNDEERQTFIDTIESTLATKAETLNSAFKHMRMKQSKLPKCPACGSTDCKEKSGGAVQELVVAARKEGYEVHDVSPDGNCMFAALVDQLEMYGDTRFDVRSLRETAVNWLKEHPHLNDGENTHFQSFIDEDLDAYLQRMRMDGEWGDHLQLRAVSNVVESTIKVLSIRNRDVVWTSICSDKDTHSSDRVLTVGNVSEHPAELVMFGSDYVDPVSGVPSCHVSFLLNAVAPLRTVLDGSAIVSSQIVDQANIVVKTFEKMPKTYHNQPIDMDPVPVGSFMEGTFHPGLCWLEGKDNEMKHWQNSGILLKMKLPKDSIVLEEESCCKFGYTRIIQPSTTLYENKLTFVYKLHFQRPPFNFPIQFRHSQPKVSGSVQMEPIYCYSISKWPDQAREWLVRKRYQNWPPQHIRSEIESKGCVLSASCHPTSDSPTIEWKYLFSEADTSLFKEALSEHQKYCYLLFRYFCMHNLSEVQPFNIDILNSIFFFSCERIPCDIEKAQYFIRHFYYEGGLEKLNEAFQERLAVSTCNDSMPFQVFLQAAFSGLNFAAAVWFALYADKMLHGQLSKTLMREVCSDLHLLRIDEVLPRDVAGSYVESEVPMSFTLAFDSFCHDYAAFLAFIGKKSEALPVLEFCAKKHKQYQSQLKEMTKTGKNVESCAFNDQNMFSVYAAIFALYNKEQENEKFCEYSDEASELVTRMKKGYAFLWLKMVFAVLYGEAGLKRLADQPKNSTPSDIEMSAKFMNWPVRYLTS